jgi:hypothetical protein
MLMLGGEAAALHAGMGEGPRMEQMDREREIKKRERDEDGARTGIIVTFACSISAV